MPEDEAQLPRLRYRPIPAGAKVVVVRGDDMDPDAERRQAEDFLRRWPAWHRYGLSAYYAEDDDAVADLASDQLERFPLLRLYRPEALTSAGIDVVPTFRSPHLTLTFDDLEAGLSALAVVEHEIRHNPYHEH